MAFAHTDASDEKDAIQLPTYDPEKAKFIIEKLQAWQPLSTIAVADEITKEKFHAWLTVGGGCQYQNNLSAFSELLMAWLETLDEDPSDNARELYLSILKVLPEKSDPLELFLLKFPTMIDFLYGEFTDPEAQFEEANKAFKLHQEKVRPDDMLVTTWEKKRGINKTVEGTTTETKAAIKASTPQKNYLVDLDTLNQQLQALKNNPNKHPQSSLKEAKVFYMRPSIDAEFNTKRILKEVTLEEYRDRIEAIDVITSEGVTCPVKPMHVADLCKKAEKPKPKSLEYDPKLLPALKKPAPEKTKNDDGVSNEDIVTQLMGRIGFIG